MEFSSRISCAFQTKALISFEYLRESSHLLSLILISQACVAIRPEEAGPMTTHSLSFYGHQESIFVREKVEDIRLLIVIKDHSRLKSAALKLGTLGGIWRVMSEASSLIILLVKLDQHARFPHDFRLTSRRYAAVCDDTDRRSQGPLNSDFGVAGGGGDAIAKSDSTSKLYARENANRK
ncbi:hypothetical protein J6590_051094 [Homalodisca vitripennis]|nr:hypothetical protein J6590_051094 [Homalodisca vitripennis]